MDLIYTNADHEDLGILDAYELDLENNSSSNDATCDFELKRDANSEQLEGGSYIYFEDSEYGGIIDTIETDTDIEETSYKGRTWQGILQRKVIEPPDNEDYYIVEGNAKTIIDKILNELGLSNLFVVENTTVTIKKYQFYRYVKCYFGLFNMLKDNNAKLKFNYYRGKVYLSVVPISDYSKDGDFDNTQLSFKIKKVYHGINHLICLGSGDLKDRTVIHLYADSKGNIVNQQVLFGVDELVDVYDYGSAESDEELENYGIKKFKELIEKDSISMPFDASEDIYDIGDIVGTTENYTDSSCTATVVRKILKVKDDEITIDCEVE